MTDTTAAKKKAWLVRLPPDVVLRWRATAARNHMSTVQLLHRAMLTVLDGAEAEVGLPEKARRAETGRIEVTLTAAELRLVKAAANHDGYSLSAWVAMLLRGVLAKQPVLTASELTALNHATVQLMRVGRNLNAIAHVLRRADRYEGTTEQLSEIAQTVGLVSSRVDALIEIAGERNTL